MNHCQCRTNWLQSSCLLFSPTMAGSDWAKEISQDPQMGLAEKWQRFSEEKKRRGAQSPYLLNRWVPWYFFNVLIGAYAWYALAAVPSHHFRDPIWYSINELFGLYVEIQLIVNWLLIHTTDSSYIPSPNDDTMSPLMDHSVSVSLSGGEVAHFRSVAAPSRDGTINVGDGGDATTFSSLGTEEEPEVIYEHKSSCQLSPRKNGLTYQMMVATAIGTDGIVQRQPYVYWSWVPCLWCNRPRPPRCHHCNLCGRCVLKRDHHCYFTRACIGVNNQRHLLKFLFWSMVMTSLAGCEVAPYTARRVFTPRSYWNAVFPVNVLNVLRGVISLTELHLIFMLWSLAFLFLVSLGMFCLHLFCALRGITKFEYDHSIVIRDTRPMFTRLRTVMGRNWGLAVLLPGYNNGPPLEDGIRWPHIKP